ncbi:MAG: Rpn family recombination-promoting nuclease/putative transposase, partial [Planctomycetaceae bacterium]|nr:Rpn family recombination-promoting nuclease/putative transposase [Planctomycetaceae bacterium]
MSKQRKKSTKSTNAPKTASLKNSTKSYSWQEPLDTQFVKTPVSHDIFFELVFQIKRVAIAFMKFILPLEFYEQLDWSKINISVSRYRDDFFKEYRTDMVYKIQLKDAGNDGNDNDYFQVGFIIEHKSYNKPHTIMQLFNYEKQAIDKEI